MHKVFFILEENVYACICVQVHVAFVYKIHFAKIMLRRCSTSFSQKSQEVAGVCESFSAYIWQIFLAKL